MTIFIISRVKNLSTAGPCAYLRFQEERKGNLVDPASSHTLVSRRNMAVLLRPASSGRFINDGRFIKAVGQASGRMAVLSTRSGQMARSLDLEHGWQFLPFPV